MEGPLAWHIWVPAKHCALPPLAMLLVDPEHYYCLLSTYFAEHESYEKGWIKTVIIIICSSQQWRAPGFHLLLRTCWKGIYSCGFTVLLEGNLVHLRFASHFLGISGHAVYLKTWELTALDCKCLLNLQPRCHYSQQICINFTLPGANVYLALSKSSY